MIRTVIDSGTNQLVEKGDRISFRVGDQQLEAEVSETALLRDIIDMHDALYVGNKLELTDGRTLEVDSIVWKRVGKVRKRVERQGDGNQRPKSMCRVVVNGEAFFVGEDGHRWDTHVRTMVSGERSAFEDGDTIELQDVTFAHSVWDFDQQDDDRQRAAEEEKRRARELYEGRKYRQAARRYLNHADFDPSVSFSNAAECFLKCGRYSQAEDACLSAIRHGDDRPKTRSRLERAKQKKNGDRQAAAPRDVPCG